MDDLLDILNDFLVYNIYKYYFTTDDNNKDIIKQEYLNKKGPKIKSYDKNIICIGTDWGYATVLGDKLPKSVVSLKHSGFKFNPDLLIDMDKSNVVNYYRCSDDGYSDVNIFEEIKRLKNVKTILYYIDDYKDRYRHTVYNEDGSRHIESISFNNGLERIDTNLERLVFYADYQQDINPIEIETDKWTMERVDFGLDNNDIVKTIIYTRKNKNNSNNA